MRSTSGPGNRRRVSPGPNQEDEARPDGRRHRGRRKAGGPGQLLTQGTKLLGQSPELTRLTDEIRGRLLDAGKAAAVAVATRQVEALTERVMGRVGTVTDVGGQTVTDVGDTVGDVGRSVGDVSRRVGGRPRPNDDQYDDETASADTVDDEDAAVDEDAAIDEDQIDEDALDEDEEDAAGDEEPTDEDAVDDEEGDAAPVEAPPPVRRRAPRTAANARRADDAGVTRAAAAAGSAAVRSTGRRSGRSAGARQEGSND